MVLASLVLVVVSGARDCEELALVGRIQAQAKQPESLA
jgi:hypothetical protein